MADATLAAGARFGDYEIQGELGAGGMGRVYRALDRTLDRPVALKTLAPELAAEPGFIERFQREARAVARLNHPNIVQIYAFGAVAGTWYLAMELLDGHSLGHYLQDGHWPEAEALLIVRQACQALGVAHAEGIVHRDIKPDNLILTRRGEVKVVDLGIAKRLGDEHSMTQTGSAIGTPHYISPEQVRGQRDLDARADIYSLGATLYHLVTGHTPYTGSSGAHVMSQHLFAPLPDPRTFEPGLSEGLCRVLRKMMAKEREERYPDVAALDRDLYQLQLGQTPETVEPSSTAVESGFVAGRGAAGGEREAPARFDSAVLGRIEETLAGAVGPMARVLVRQGARGATSLEALCDQLAGHLESAADRDAFRRRCLACGGLGTGGGATPAPPTAEPNKPNKRLAPSRGGEPDKPDKRLAPSRTAGPAEIPGAAGSAPAAPPLAEGDLVGAESELARLIGPLARVLVRRAARQATSLADLVALLAPAIPDEAGRAAFRRAVLRVD